MTASMFLAPRFVGALGIAWGEDKALQYARDLREKTDILLTRAPRESLLQSGERVISVGEIDSQVRAWIAEGLPLAFVVPEPVIVGQFGASVMAKAPNPNAARLMAGYLASVDGKARAREGDASRATMARPPTNELAKRLHSGGTQVVHDTVQIMAAKEALYPKAAVDPDRPGEVTSRADDPLASPLAGSRVGAMARIPRSREEPELRALDSLDLTRKARAARRRGPCGLSHPGAARHAAVRGVSRAVRLPAVRAGRALDAGEFSRDLFGEPRSITRILPDTFDLRRRHGRAHLHGRVRARLADRAHRPAGPRDLVRDHPVSAAGADPGAGDRVDLPDGAECRLAQSGAALRSAASRARARSTCSACRGSILCQSLASVPLRLHPAERGAAHA